MTEKFVLNRQIKEQEKIGIKREIMKKKSNLLNVHLIYEISFYKMLMHRKSIYNPFGLKRLIYKIPEQKKMFQHHEFV